MLSSSIDGTIIIWDFIKQTEVGRYCVDSPVYEIIASSLLDSTSSVLPSELVLVLGRQNETHTVRYTYQLLSNSCSRLYANSLTSHDDIYKIVVFNTEKNRVYIIFLSPLYLFNCWSLSYLDSQKNI